MQGCVLIADDDRTIRTVLSQAFKRAGCEVHATASMKTLEAWVREGLGDLVISDVMMPDGNGLDLLPRIRAERPNLPVIIVSAQNNILTAISASEGDAFDYLPKPFDLPELIARSAAALQRHGYNHPPLPAEAPSPQISSDAFPPHNQADSRAEAPHQPGPPDAIATLPLLGRAPQMQVLYRLLAKVIHTQHPLLICGESGTGKSLLARAIHQLSQKSAAPFITLHPNEPSDPAQLMARIAQAAGGSIVIENLKDWSADAQACLLHALDHILAEGHTRVIATAQLSDTSAPPPPHLRTDLFYRLSTITLHMPPLRERREDIPLLCAHFLSQGAAQARPNALQKPAPDFTAAAQTALRNHPWPGNVRHLENTMYQLMATAPGGTITLESVQAVLARSPTKPHAENAGPKHETLAASCRWHINDYFTRHGNELPPPGTYQRVLREFEAPLIEIALAATQGNQAKCADLLGINRNTLRKKIRELEILVTKQRKLM